MHGATGPVSAIDLRAEAGRFDASAQDAVIESLLTSLLPAALALLASTPSPGADTLARAVRTLPVVEVDAERARIEARRRAPTAIVSELPAGASNRAFESVGELLQTSVGARVVSYGGLGAFSSVSLRGASPGQVTVLMDGVPVTSAVHGVVDLAELPLGSLERIEVWRSGAPLAFGSATPGGAVNLVTADAPRVRAARVAAGSYGTVSGGGALGGTRGAFAWLGSAGGESSRGDFRFTNDNATPLNPDDDATATRLNDRVDAAHGLARLAWTPARRARVVTRLEGFHKAQGVPGPGAAQAPHPRLTLDRGQAALEAALAPGGRAFGALLRGHAKRERSHFRDREGELHFGRQDVVMHAADDALAWEVSTPEAWPWVGASAGVEARAERAEAAPPTLGLPAPPPSRRDTRSAWANVRVRAFGERLVLDAGTRADRQHDQLRATLVGGSAWSADTRRTLETPRLGARLALPLAFEARGGVARTARAPEFGELFGDAGVVSASPTLKPEHGDHWDASLAWRGRRGAWSAEAEAAHHHAEQHDVIAWILAQGRTARATNFARVTIRGDELAARLAWRTLALSGSTAWTDARQVARDNIYFDKRLPLRPARQDYVRLDARAGAWRAAADVLDLGAEFGDAANRRRLAPRTIVGASLAFAWRALSLTLECKNVGDVRYVDALQYPIPGRTLFVSLETSGRSAARP